MSRRRGSKKRTNGGGDGLLTQRQIIQEYGVSKNQIHRYFPKPQLQTVRMRNGAYWNIGVWPREQVEKIILHPEIARSLEEKRNEQNEQKQVAEIREIFQTYSPEGYVERARQMKRSFVLHVGPTNSGKTFDAIEDLKKNIPGTYLGPLRLLALEMFDKLNDAGIPCSMLTGEESIPVEGDRKSVV